MTQSTEIIRFYPQTWPPRQDDCPETEANRSTSSFPNWVHTSSTGEGWSPHLSSRVPPLNISSDHLFLGVGIKGLEEKTDNPRSRVSTGEQASGTDPSLPVDGCCYRQTQESQVSRVLESCLEFQEADVAPPRWWAHASYYLPRNPYPLPCLLLERLWLLMLKALSRSPSCLHPPMIHIKYDNVICLLGRGGWHTPTLIRLLGHFFQGRKKKNTCHPEKLV